MSFCTKIYRVTMFGFLMLGCASGHESEEIANVRQDDAIREQGAASPAKSEALREDSEGSDTDTDWDRLAACESGANWGANTGNGLYGGLQMNATTWHANGGTNLPHQNSKAEQIRIAEKIRDAYHGYGTWPCAVKLGLPI
jgi:hypothetical protein